MRRIRWRDWLVVLTLVVSFVGDAPGNSDVEGQNTLKVHYIEIVSSDVATQCEVLERVHGLSFGPEVADLGYARVAERRDGSLIGVRAPLAEHEQPTTRTYLAVGDISKAVKDAEEAGAVIAYPPTRQGETGTWAIYIVDGIQFGLWQP